MKKEIMRLNKICFDFVRPNILKAIYNSKNSGHPAGSFSIVEQLVVLYDKILELNKKERDIFILGSGHNAPALYSVLAYYNFFDIEAFTGGYRQNSIFAGHPKRNIPGVELNTGSLGNSLSTAVELANLSSQKKRDDKTRPKVFFLEGNAALNEGSTLEALANAGKRNINNLVFIINNNQYCLDNKASEQYREILLSLGFIVLGQELFLNSPSRSITDLCDKPEALNFYRKKDHIINGNDLVSTWKTLSHAVELIDSRINHAPIAVIFNTVKGHGHEIMAGDNRFHSKVPGRTLEIALKGIKPDKCYVNPSITVKKKSISGIIMPRIFRDLAGRYPDLFFMSADTGSSTGIIAVKEVDDKRYIDVGCGEQHLVLGTLAFELFKKPVIACTFDQFFANRAREQIITISQNFETTPPRSSIILVGTHHGLSSGKDDMSHHSINTYDLASIPHLHLFHAADEAQFTRMIEFAIGNPGFYYIIIGKESEIRKRQNSRYILSGNRILRTDIDNKRILFNEDYKFEPGIPTELRKGTDIAIIVTGLSTYDAMDAADIAACYGIDVGVIQISTVSDINGSYLSDILENLREKRILIVEENVFQGGLGQKIKALLANQKYEIRCLNIRGYSGSACYDDLLKENSLDINAMISGITRENRFLKEKNYLTYDINSMRPGTWFAGGDSNYTDCF